MTFPTSLENLRVVSQRALPPPSALHEEIPASAAVTQTVSAARRALAGVENAMFHAAPPEEIPWRDSYFTVILSPPPQTPLAETEIRRVLTPGGIIHLLP